MLYLIGGASRAGKSLLARRLLVEHGVPGFPLDALMMAAVRQTEHGFAVRYGDSAYQRATNGAVAVHVRARLHGGGADAGLRFRG